MEYEDDWEKDRKGLRKKERGVGWTTGETQKADKERQREVSKLPEMHRFTKALPVTIPIDRARVRADHARERKGRFICLKAGLIDLPPATSDVPCLGLKSALSTFSRPFKVTNMES